MNREQTKELATSLGCEVIAAARRLKPEWNGMDNYASIPMEFYLVDEDFDVLVRVSLKKKKSQKQIGEEMFGVTGSEPVEK